MSPGFPSASPGSRSGFCFGRAFSCPPAPDWCSSCASTSRPAGPSTATTAPWGRTARWCGCSCPAPFPHLLYGLLLCFLALALSLAGVAVYHFLCHYQGGRSIYRMRLLPQFGELWRRCLSAPALALLLGAALTAAVILLCALCYYHLTPAGHLPPEPWGGLPLGWIGGNHA